MNVLFTAQSKNSKTGNVPTAWVGESKEEAWNSCEGCSLRGNGCYAWRGSVQLGFLNVARANRNGADKSLEFALENRHKDAKMFRLTAIGDIGRCGDEIAASILSKIDEAGLEPVGYTHHWREENVAETWKGVLMASCETEDDADLAVSQGWRATMIVDESVNQSFYTKAGNKVVICPAQTKKGITCNDCRLCNGKKKAAPIIAFQVHGKASNVIKTEGHLAKLDLGAIAAAE